MKKILVPTDFSKCAESAAKTAASIAKRTGADIYLLHLLSIPYYSSNSSIENRRDIPEAIFIIKRVHKQMAELKSRPFFKGVRVIEAVIFDSDHDRIVEDAKKNDIDLIVMGTHGLNGFKETFFGSVTEKVARKAHCPVIAVKENQEELEIKNIVFASDFSEEARDVFTNVLKFAGLYGDPSIHLLKINTPLDFKPSFENRQLLLDFASSFTGLNNYTINIYDDHVPEEGILHFSKDVNADMIVLGTHGRTGISHMLKGSIAEDLVNHAPIPVMSLPIKNPVADDYVPISPEV